ncbi:hypothetical protein [Halorubellus salinus]|uniref:hypothetical protein n=1 Tax=Halorubellus salinus TaxID=755309 RepID=UPI001D08C6C0|nr:hypothetical protein [Halorubellus salinus]
MSDGSLGPGAQAVVVLAVLAAFALATTAAVVAVGVGPITDAVPASSESVPDQPGAVVGDDGSSKTTVTGRVRATDGTVAGNATVVLARHPEPLFSKATPSELAAVVDDETSTDLTVVEARANGSFAGTVPAGEYDVVALRDGNVSAVRTVNATAGGGPVATGDLALRADRKMTYEASDSTVEPGENATVTVAVYNRDDDPASLSVSYFPTPQGWRVVDYRGSADRVNETTRTFHFENVSAGAWARAELVVQAPANATRGERTAFGATASAREPGPGGEFVVTWRGRANVSVPANETTSVTRTPGSVDDATEGTGTAGDETTTRPDLPGQPLPGFALALALAATTLVVAAFAARQQA